MQISDPAVAPSTQFDVHVVVAGLGIIPLASCLIALTVKAVRSCSSEAAGFGVRVNAVAPGPTDTGMLTRFTGAPENKAALLAGVPMGRLDLSEELAKRLKSDDERRADPSYL